MAEGSAEELFGRLKALELPEGDYYAVFGSGPLAARGLMGEVGDLGVGARGAAWERAKALGPASLAPGGGPVVRLGGGDIEVFGGWLGWDVGVLVARAGVVGVLPFARLEDVLAFKLSHGRPENLAHARLIEQHLRTS